MAFKKKVGEQEEFLGPMNLKTQRGRRIVGYRVLKNVSNKMKVGDQIVIHKPEIMEAMQLVSMIKPRACLQGLQGGF